MLRSSSAPALLCDPGPASCPLWACDLIWNRERQGQLLTVLLCGLTQEVEGRGTRAYQKQKLSFRHSGSFPHSPSCVSLVVPGGVVIHRLIHSLTPQWLSSTQPVCWARPCRLQLTVSSGDTPQIGPQRPTPRPSCLPFRGSPCWSLCREGPFSPSPQTSRCDHASLSTPQANCLLAEFPVTGPPLCHRAGPLLFPATCFSVSPTDWDLPRQGPAFVSWHPCRPWPGKTPITFFLKLW